MELLYLHPHLHPSSIQPTSTLHPPHPNSPPYFHPTNLHLPSTTPSPPPTPTAPTRSSVVESQQGQVVELEAVVQALRDKLQEKEREVEEVDEATRGARRQQAQGHRWAAGRSPAHRGVSAGGAQLSLVTLIKAVKLFKLRHRRRVGCFDPWL